MHSLTTKNNSSRQSIQIYIPYNILGCWHQKPKAKGKEDGPLKTLGREKIFSVGGGKGAGSPSAERPNPVEVTAARLPGLINHFDENSVGEKPPSTFQIIIHTQLLNLLDSSGALYVALQQTCEKHTKHANGGSHLGVYPRFYTDLKINDALLSFRSLLALSLAWSCEVEGKWRRFCDDFKNMKIPWFSFLSLWPTSGVKESCQI